MSRETPFEPGILVLEARSGEPYNVEMMDSGVRLSFAKRAANTSRKEAVASSDRNFVEPIREPLPWTISRDDFTPALISLISSASLWGGSRIFNHKFDLGSNDWRVLSALSNEPGSTASEVCSLLGMNKSIASRSINALLPRQLITIDASGGTKKLFLTQAGADMHNDIIPIVLERERIMQINLTPGEIATLRGLLLKMLESADALQAFDTSVLAETGVSESTGN